MDSFSIQYSFTPGSLAKEADPDKMLLALPLLYFDYLLMAETPDTGLDYYEFRSWVFGSLALESLELMTSPSGDSTSISGYSRMFS